MDVLVGAGLSGHGIVGLDKELDMGGDIRRDTPLMVDGHEGFVAGRVSDDDEAQRWSITARPYRPKPSDDMLKDMSCSSCSSCTCFVAGNRVLMADGSLKPIEQVEVGDMVMTMSGPDRIRMTERPLLGMTRRVVEIHGTGDQCLFMSDEHPLWVSYKDGAGERVEGWGTYNLSHTLYEMRNSIEPNRMMPPYAMCFDLPEQVAHVNGWLHVRPIYHHLSPETQLYNVVTENACSFFVEGFAVCSHGLKEIRPSRPWRGLEQDADSQKFVRTVTAESV